MACNVTFHHLITWLWKIISCYILNEAVFKQITAMKKGFGCWLCWGLTSQSTIFQSYRDGAIASWVINQYFWGVKCLAQGHNTAAVGLEPRTSRSGVRHSTTEPPRSPNEKRKKEDKINVKIKWATARQNQQNDMSDQSLRCALSG